MNRFLNMAEKAIYIVLISLGAVFFLSAFLGSSMLNMITRLLLGSVLSICGMLELVPDLLKKYKRRKSNETGIIKTSRIQRNQIKIRQR